MVFSCLVDADFLCTERFMRGRERSRLASDAVDVMRDRLEARVAGFYPPRTSLNARRCELLEACREAARAPHGVFSLTAPTFRFTDEDAAKYGPMIAEFAREISRQLP